MTSRAHLVLRFALLLTLAFAAARAAEIPNAAQPQLAAAADGRVWLAFGRGQEIFVARSDDRGATFGAPVRVAALPSLMLGRRRGPRIAAHGDQITVTAMAGELFAFHSKDAGKTWVGPVLINDARRSAREGLNGLAVAPDGRLFTTWLDLRDVAHARTQLYGAESTDGGATWSANQLVYRAPAGQTVCECCHPSALFNARGDLVVMWRNAIDGARDLWSAVRPAGASDFGAAAKIGEGSWTLKACPMDGGMVFPQGEGFATIWQRAGAVFLARPGEAEQRLDAGTQPVALEIGGATRAFWQQGADLWSARLGASPTPPARYAAGGRFPALLALPGGDAVLAFERGAAVIVERVTARP